MATGRLQPQFVVMRRLFVNHLSPAFARLAIAQAHDHQAVSSCAFCVSTYSRTRLILPPSISKTKQYSFS
jgi:hypothetical protein